MALSLNKGALEPRLIIRERGVLSDRFALLLPPILEGVIGMLPRGDTREKQR